MSKTYRVDTGGESFFITITELFGCADGALLVGFAASIVALYLVFGTPIISWPVIYGEFQEEFGSNVPFIVLLGAQLAFAVTRASTMSEVGESSVMVELLLEMACFLVMFEVSQAIGFYLAFREIDPVLLQEYGIYDVSFFAVLRQQVMNTYGGLSTALAAVFLSYTGAVLPTLASCCLGNLMRK